jgi:xylulokinase
MNRKVFWLTVRESYCQCISTTRPAYSPAGLAEHDPEKTWWGDFVLLTKTLLEKSQISSKDIAGIGVSAIAPCMLPVDQQGNPLRMGVLYGVDTRAYREIDELNARFGKENLFAKPGMNSLHRRLDRKFCG